MGPNDSLTNPTGSSTQSGGARARLMSLDALRGLDMFCIIGGDMVLRSLVKASGRDSLQWIPEQLTHVRWEGFHFIDLIFPLFLFLIGVSIPYSFGKRLARGDGPLRLYSHVFLRVTILIVLGMMVNGNLLTYNPKQFQITYSVLQMLALGYLVASVVYLNLRLPWQIATTVALLVIYWLLLAFVPGPGHQMGVVQERGNLGDWLNDWLLGDLQGPWRFGWILGILGHASTALFGVFAGETLRSSWTAVRKMGGLILLGLVCLGIAYIWSGMMAADLSQANLVTQLKTWPAWFPIIKNRWTSTFALYAAGWSNLLLALFYLVIDVWKIRFWAFPFVVIGANSIFAYMCWQLGNSVFRSAANIFLGGLKPYVGPDWFEAISWAGATALLWLLLWYLYRNRTFIRA